MRGCGAAGSAPHWQCGGQGFESPQLHPDDQAVPPGESGLSRLWLQLALLYLSAVGPHAVGGFAGQGRHDVALSVHCRAHLAVAEHLLDEPRVFLSMGQP